jgi:hypothetical protein
LFIGIDGIRAFLKYLGKSAPSAHPAAAKS